MRIRNSFSDRVPRRIINIVSSTVENQFSRQPVVFLRRKMYKYDECDESVTQNPDVQLTPVSDRQPGRARAPRNKYK